MTIQFNQIAAELGGTFHYLQFQDDAPMDDRGYITLPDGIKFFIKHGGYRMGGRITVSPSYPKHVDNTRLEATANTVQTHFMRASESLAASTNTVMTVADTKTPKQIAQDITRRFLPTYRDCYRLAQAWCAEQYDYYAKQKTVNENLMTAFDGLREIQGGTGYVTVKSFSPKSVNVSIDWLSPANAVKLGEFLRTLK